MYEFLFTIGSTHANIHVDFFIVSNELEQFKLE